MDTRRLDSSHSGSLRRQENQTVRASWKRGFALAKAASAHAQAPSASKRMGAALMAGSNVVSVGFNTYGKTHPDNCTKDFARSVHAEHSALLKRRHYEHAAQVMYVYRETFDGQPACSRPCPNCLHLMKLSGVRRVRFITESGGMEEMKL